MGMDELLYKLMKSNLFSNVNELAAIKTGASGSGVYEAAVGGAEYIVKYTGFADASQHLRDMTLREYRFLELAKSVGCDFVPDVAYSALDDDGALIVERKYRVISPAEWNEGMLSRAMETCAKVHLSDAAQFGDALASASSGDDAMPLTTSHNDWLALANKFPELVDSAIVNAIYARFSQLDAMLNGSGLPVSLCHGDCHPENFLLDGDNMVICDWQNASIGVGAGDIAFFLNRGADMGLNIDADKLLTAYSNAYKRLSGADICVDVLKKYIAASKLSVSFRFWAYYLQDAGTDRILPIYADMVDNYRFVFGLE